MIRKIVTDPTAARFDRLYRRLYPVLFAIAYRVVRHREDAEDVVQDAFLTHRELDFEVPEGVTERRWLTILTVNEARHVVGLDPLPLPDTFAPPSPSWRRAA